MDIYMLYSFLPLIRLRRLPLGMFLILFSHASVSCWSHITEISFARLFSFSTVILLFLSVDPLGWPPCLQDGSVSVDVLDCCCMSIIDAVMQMMKQLMDVSLQLLRLLACCLFCPLKSKHDLPWLHWQVFGPCHKGFSHCLLMHFLPPRSCCIDPRALLALVHLQC